MFSLTIEDEDGRTADQFSFDHGSYVVGRHENCDIVLPSASVSREHARIFVRDGRCFIEDRESANGVQVDGQPVTHSRGLGTAAQIRIGDYYLYLEQIGESQRADEVRDTLYIAEGADHHKLVRVNDEFAGEEFPLSERKNTVGRTDENFILLSDPSISRQHAVIRRNADRYLLEDKESSNGTRVDGREVSNSRELNPGDLVEFGKVQFVFARGDQNVETSQYSDPGLDRSDILFVTAAAVLVLVALLAAGLLLFGLP